MSDTTVDVLGVGKQFTVASVPVLICTITAPATTGQVINAGQNTIWVSQSPSVTPSTGTPVLPCAFNPTPPPPTQLAAQGNWYAVAAAGLPSVVVANSFNSALDSRYGGGGGGPFAPIASPTFTGLPAVPTAAPGTNTTQAANTAFVQAAVVAATTGVASFDGRTGAVVPTTGDYAVGQVTGAAPLVSPSFTTPALGTPASGVATNLTGTAAGLTAGAVTGLSVVTSKTLTVDNSLTLAGTDTTTMTFPGATDTVAGLAAAQTLSNKRIKARVVAVTQAAAPATDTDNMDKAVITGLAQAVTSFTTNLTGTPNDGDVLVLYITDNGTARALAWGAKFASTSVALPTTTVASTTLRVFLLWNAAASVWECTGTP